jgi:hypothetical protein
MLFFFEAWVLLAVAKAGIDLTPIIVAIIGLGGIIGGAGFWVKTSTNRKLQAEGSKITQDAISAVEQRGAVYVTTMDRIRRVLEERLAATERDLVAAKRALEVTEERFRVLRVQADRLEREKDDAVRDAMRERDLLRARIVELERQVDELQHRIA